MLFDPRRVSEIWRQHCFLSDSTVCLHFLLSLSLLFKVRREYVATILMLIAPTERSWNQRPITSAQLWLHCMQQCEMSSSKDLISLRPFSILFTPDFCSVLITPRTARGTPATTPASPVCVRPSDGPCAWLDIRFLFSSSIQPPLPQQLSAQAAQHSPLSTVCTFHLGAFEGAGVAGVLKGGVQSLWADPYALTS